LRIPTFFLVPVLLLGATAAAQEQDAEQYFNTNCKACHTIGGGVILGPDLKGVMDRKDREWLVDFIVDPESKLDSDPYAMELLAASPGGAVRMLKVPGITPLIANSLLDYISSKSGAASAEAAPVDEPEPFIAEDIAAGEDYFTGAKSFRNGAPACNSCHTTVALGGWGGGALGPDLTQAYTRLGARTGLTGWLGMPASAIMQPIFSQQKLTKEEIHALVAFLEKESESGADAAPSVTASFLGAGVLLAVALLALFGFLWKGRYTSTRIPMVEKSKR
jgi:mono/diheme cytochrome c family protein